MWFEKLVGFKEENPAQVRENLGLDNFRLSSTINGAVYQCGILEIPSLAILRKRVDQTTFPIGQLTLREEVANVQDLHLDPQNEGAFFQAASQFNLLEMVGPEVTPEEGIGIYEFDRTQGPACAIACGAGTIYRNYFAEVNGKIGQTAFNQIDCLKDMGDALGNADKSLWEMKNGYALASRNGLQKIRDQLNSISEEGRDALRETLRIGLQWNTQVTLNDCTHTVTQAYCSALPVAYSRHSAADWKSFAELVLEASYEATICAAALNFKKTGNNKLYLTLLGGGAFGNHSDWIFKALDRAIKKYATIRLEVILVSYGRSQPDIQDYIRTVFE